MPAQLSAAFWSQDRTLSETFAADDAEAMISPRAPSCYLERVPYIFLASRSHNQ